MFSCRMATRTEVYLMIFDGVARTPRLEQARDGCVTDAARWLASCVCCLCSLQAARSLDGTQNDDVDWTDWNFGRPGLPCWAIDDARRALALARLTSKGLADSCLASSGQSLQNGRHAYSRRFCFSQRRGVPALTLVRVHVRRPFGSACALSRVVLTSAERVPDRARSGHFVVARQATHSLSIKTSRGAKSVAAVPRARPRLRSGLLLAPCQVHTTPRLLPWVPTPRTESLNTVQWRLILSG
jgi:hypothetical protein